MVQYRSSSSPFRPRRRERDGFLTRAVQDAVFDMRGERGIFRMYALDTLSPLVIGRDRLDELTFDWLHG